MAEGMKAPNFPPIPVPGADLLSLHNTCLALKQCVEMLAGNDAKSRDGSTANRYASHIFVQATEPTALHEGDLWLCDSATFTLSIWRQNKWLLLLTLP